MDSKKILAIIWRLLFTIAYTAVVLPFTSNFFATIAQSPVSDYQFLKLFLLSDAHKFMLPIFLGSIEFASVTLASIFWKRSDGYEKWIFVPFVFLFLQVLPVSSVYFDIRSRDFYKEKVAKDSLLSRNVATHWGSLSTYDNLIKNDSQPMIATENLTIGQKLDLLKTKNDNLESIRRDIRTFQNDRKNYMPSQEDTLIERKNDKIQNRNQIDSRISNLIKQEQNEIKSISELESEVLSLQKEVQNKEANRTKSLNSQKDSLLAIPSKFKTDVENIEKSFPYKSEYEYIVEKVNEPKSLFAFLIAFIFPTAVFAMGRVLPSIPSETELYVSSFNLQSYLNHANNLKKENHYNFASLLVPSLTAYVIALKASKTVANENVILHLRDELVFQVIANLKKFEEQILSSNLEEDAKNLLLSEIQKIINRELITKEDISYAKT